MGLEPTTPRLRVSCSTDWASRADVIKREFLFCRRYMYIVRHLVDYIDFYSDSFKFQYLFLTLSKAIHVQRNDTCPTEWYMSNGHSANISFYWTCIALHSVFFRYKSTCPTQPVYMYEGQKISLWSQMAFSQRVSLSYSLYTHYLVCINRLVMV